MKEVAAIDRAIDELLVQLGEVVLRLSSPEVTKRDDERRALMRSGNQFSHCAARSGYPRVQELKAELDETIKPRLRLVSSRQALAGSDHWHPLTCENSQCQQRVLSVAIMTTPNGQHSLPIGRRMHGPQKKMAARSIMVLAKPACPSISTLQRFDRMCPWRPLPLWQH